MAFYVVTYDLRKKAESEYLDLWNELESMDSVKTRNQSTWYRQPEPKRK
jgi:hypothetical protein